MTSSSSSLLSLVLLSASFLILYSSEFHPFACAAVTRGNVTDVQSLLAFRNGVTSDPSGVLNSWNHSIHFCQWFGVTCGHRHRQRVTELNLEGLGLKGVISPHIGNLSFLTLLWLSNNSLGRTIPPEIGRLRRLKMMSLLSNTIGGEIPVNISSCSNLVVLELSRNNLEGMIPSEIGILSKLEELHVGYNKIAGVIPAVLANISSLRVFYAPFNIITGSIPDQLGRLSNLEFFCAPFNNLIGTIPPSIWNISSIEFFSVSHNQIGGVLPSELGGIIFPLLSTLHIFTNLFSGTIPVSISNASYLENLDMRDNKFTGDVPPMKKLVHLRFLQLGDNSLGNAGKLLDDLSFLSSLTNSSNLEDLDLSNNAFGGELPKSIGNLSINAISISLVNNKISGSIPDEIGNLVNMEILQFNGNEIRGSIPSTLVKLHKLQILTLSSNEFDGTIPLSFGNLSILSRLYLYENSLHGNIPRSLGNCTKLQILSLFSNNLQGNIPKEIFSNPSLYVLGLAHNRLTGFLPTEVGTLINLVLLDISQNLLSGVIPSTLGRCVTLTVLDMGANNFEGILPSSLSSLRGLEEFILSRNNFSGEIPLYLEGFPFLQNLDLSFNDFKGPVPDKGVFTNVTAFHMEGNINLCGGVSEFLLPGCPAKASKNVNRKLIIVLALGATTGVVLMFSLLYPCLSKKRIQVLSLRVPWNTLLKLSYQSLHESTNGFSATNLIGVGSFGSVYKGLLHQSQQIVAVKVLNLQHRGASRSFMAECEALRRIRHRNLLKVLTVCSSIDHQGNDFKALVYEFMSNGSLDDWLHSRDSQDEMPADARSLDLSQRLDIVIGVAYAIEYLHHRCAEPIVHCDLKPSNILLDNDMVAHVGDFGLAKFLEEGTTNQSFGNPSSTIGLRGSVGYVAPEYGMGNEVSTFGDVYSFGIIILETFTGKRPTDQHLFDGYLNIRDYIEKVLPEQMETVADSRLLVDENRDTTRSDHQNQDSTPSSLKTKQCLLSLFRIGIACAQEQPRDRLAITDVIAQLYATKKALLRTSTAHEGGSATLAIESQVP